jgi:hypothetical protein
VHEQDWPAVLALLTEPPGHARTAVRFRVPGPHGAWRWLEAKGGVQAFDAHGKPRMSAGVVSDVTTLVRADTHHRLQVAFSDVMVGSPDRDTLARAILDTVLGLQDLDGGGLYLQDSRRQLCAARRHRPERRLSGRGHRGARRVAARRDR